MKKILLFIGVLAACCVSCSDKKKQKDPSEYILRPPEMEYVHQDTVEIANLVDQYVNFMKANNYEGAAQLLYRVQNDSIKPLSEQDKKMFARVYSNYKIYDAKQSVMILRSAKNNQVNLILQIAEDGNIEREQGVIKMSLNPVVKDGRWYLTLLDKEAEGVVDYYAPNTN